MKWRSITVGVATGVVAVVSSEHIAAQQLFRFPAFGDKFYLRPYHNSVWRTPLIADFDGDGVPDVAGIEHLPSSRPPVVYINLGNGQMQERVVLGGAGEANIVGLAAADVDRDGDIDLLALRGSLAMQPFGARNILYLNDGAGNLREAPAGLLPPDADSSVTAAFVDVDGDGDLDLFVANRGPNRLYLNDGAGHFVDVSLTHIPADNANSTSIAVADFDRDGWQDILVGNGCSNRFICGPPEPDDLYMNLGGGRFRHAAFPVDATRTDGIATGDVDSDGDIDLVLGQQAPKPRLLLNNGFGAFSDESARVADSYSGTWAPLLVDVDGDGDLDLLQTDVYRAVLGLNDGAGYFTAAPAALFEQHRHLAGAWSASDVDGDGDVDLVCADPYFVALNLRRQVITPPDPALGTDYQLTVYADAGVPTFAALSLARRPLPIPGWGTWQLDPVLTLAWPIATPGATRTLSLRVPIPLDAGLRGQTVYAQAIDLQFGGRFSSFMFDTIR